MGRPETAPLCTNGKPRKTVQESSRVVTRRHSELATDRADSTMSSASVVASADLRVCVKVPRATRRRISRISAKGAGSGEPVVRVLETAVAEETRAVGAPDDDVAGVNDGR